MWRNLILASTTAVALFTGTAFAVASPPEPDAPASESTVQLDHWSEMRIEMENQWPAMIDHVDGTFGIRFPEMVRAMELYGPRMHGSDMHDLMNDPDMRDFMNGPDMEGFMGQSGMEGMEDFMNGPDMEGFMGQSGMGGPA